MTLVGVLMGSKSDLNAMQPCLDTLSELGIDHEHHVMSAHRTPQKVQEYASGAEARGLEVIIAAAGMAAALPGTVTAWTNLPVIGVPLASGALNGVDSLYAIVQMPPGLPVATVAINGAKNAAYLAAQILSLKHPQIAEKYAAFRREMREG
ncbi:MAG TPA: 5-(carboxyamino)imidazole ribonucleotide mutase [Dehalococcoidia bacterium]|nr:5-(carboxyamino)imidazole ribonucleotide mutase [Dehalococcoidia bacterium]